MAILRILFQSSFLSRRYGLCRAASANEEDVQRMQSCQLSHTSAMPFVSRVQGCMRWHQLAPIALLLHLLATASAATPLQSFQLNLPSRIVHSHPLNRTLPVNWGAAWEERGWIPHKEGSSRAMILAKVNRHIKVYETHHPDFLASLLNHINYLNLLGCGPTLVSGGLFLTYLN